MPKKHDSILHHTDPVENAFAVLCDGLKIDYIRPAGRLDFYLPAFGLYVECKAHSCEQLHGQLESVAGKPVMVLVGVGAVAALSTMFSLWSGVR